MKELLQNLYDRYRANSSSDTFGTLSRQEEQSLLNEHARHFHKRTRVLDPAFFPGREKTKEGIRSVSHGAYASFRQEPNYDGEPAFIHTTTKALPPTLFLYYWRSSATIEFLRRNGSSDLKARLNLLRRISLHLKQGFVQVGDHRGEALWACTTKVPARTPNNEPRLDLLDIDVRAMRGRAEIEAVLMTLGLPLTRSEIAGVLQRLNHEAPQRETPIEDAPMEALGDPQRSTETNMVRREVSARVQKFFDDLSEEEKTMLGARGYSDATRPLRSFREVSELIGGRGPESFRLMERTVLRSFGEAFSDAEESTIAAQSFMECIQGFNS